MKSKYYKVGDILCSHNTLSDFDVIIIKKIEDHKICINYILLYNNKLIRASAGPGPRTAATVWYYKEDFLEKIDNFHKMNLEEYRKAIRLVFV